MLDCWDLGQPAEPLDPTKADGSDANQRWSVASLINEILKCKFKREEQICIMNQLMMPWNLEYCTIGVEVWIDDKEWNDFNLR
jgi:hypothetical protein